MTQRPGDNLDAELDALLNTAVYKYDIDRDEQVPTWPNAPKGPDDATQ